WIIWTSFPLDLLKMDFLLSIFTFLATALLLIIVAFSALMLRIYTGKSIKDPKYAPVAGTVFNQIFYFNRLYDYLAEIGKRHHTFRLLAPEQSELYTTETRNIEHILKTNFENYAKGQYNQDIVTDLFGEGIFVVDGVKWRQQRKLASFEFSTRVLRDFSCTVFRKNAGKLARTISEFTVANRVFDIQDLLMKCTLDSIFKVGFGVDLNCLEGSSKEGSAFIKAFDDSNALIYWRYVDPFWKLKRSLNIGCEASLKKNIKVLYDFVHELIRKKREQEEMQQNCFCQDKCYSALIIFEYLTNDIPVMFHDYKNDKEDILSRFLVESKKDPEEMNDRYLRDIILNFMIAGKDTTANTLSWFFYMLSKNPLIQEKVAQEVEEVIGSQGSEARADDFVTKITDEALEKMHYLHATLTETLRLYPAVPIAGPRICLGRDFAYRQMKIVSITLLHFFWFKLANDTKRVTYRTMFTLHIDGGLHLRAVQRQVKKQVWENILLLMLLVLSHFYAGNRNEGWYNYTILKDLLGDGIFAVDGEKWCQQRKVSSHEFSTKDLFMKSTLDSIFKITFGVELDSICGSTEEGRKFSNAFDDSSAMTLWRYVDIFWKIKKLFNIGSEAELKKNIKVVDDFVYKLIQSKKEKICKSKVDVDIKKEDILSRFLLASDTDPKYLREIILNFIVAGKDTSAAVLSWFIYMLCKHPTMQERIAQEIKEATNMIEIKDYTVFAGGISEEALEKMQYLHAALTETLRLYPTVPVDAKICASDDIFPDGYSVKKGDMVAYQPYAMGRMKFIWGEDAEDFKPERWLDNNGIFQQESPFKFTAFQVAINRLPTLNSQSSLLTFPSMASISIDFLCNPLAISVSALSLILPLLILAIRLLRKPQGKKKEYHPVGGTIFNQLINFNRLHHYMTDLARKHRTYRLISPFRSEIYTADPANVEYILKTNFGNYGKGWHNYSILRDLLGDGIFTVDGDKWRQQRKVSSYEFSTKVLRDFSSVIFKKNVAKLANVLSEAATSNQIVDIQDLFMKSTLDSIFKVAFGVELDSMCGSSEEGIKFSNAFDDSSALTLRRYVDITWKIKKALNIGSEAELKKNIKVIDEFVYKLIRGKTEQMHVSRDESFFKKEDILSRFLQLSDTEPKYLRDIILNFIIAGKDTTATTLSWFIYMLCKHPEVQENVAQEIKEATSKKVFTNIPEFVASLNDEALERMEYLHAVLTETLRLYPAVPVDAKICFSDDTLPDGFSVRTGDMVAYQPYAMGRMRFIWGDDAEDFRPERWLDENGSFQQESPFKFTAFQAGPRICLGREFAYRQMKIFSAVLIACFKFKLSDDKKAVNYRTMINLHIDGGLQIRAFHRFEH
ncbi:hypothetical protein RJ640_024038, partial [Escallonia rubra]